MTIDLSGTRGMTRDLTPPPWSVLTREQAEAIIRRNTRRVYLTAAWVITKRVMPWAFLIYLAFV